MENSIPKKYDLETIVWDAVSGSVIALVGFPFLMLAITRRVDVFLWFVLGTLVAYLASHFLKMATGSIDPAGKRPRGATDCDVFNRNGCQEGKPGWPSGHMTLTVFVLVFAAFALRPAHPGAYCAAAVMLSVLMGAARIRKRCHTVGQVVSGALLGALLALLWASRMSK
jgi:membrane-associated phospholipid phosphatase